MTGETIRSTWVWLRLAAVVLVAVAGTVAAWRLASGPTAALCGALRSGRVERLDLDALVTGSAGATVVVASSGLLAIIATTLVQEALASSRPAVAGLIPTLGPFALRRLILTLCGLCGLSLVGVTTPAFAAHSSDPPPPMRHAVLGLELPDLPAGGFQGRTPTQRRPSTVVVHRGDSLWSITQRLIGGDAGTRRIAKATHDLYLANRARIGPDPDLIQPHTVLTVPEDLDDNH